MPLGPEFDGYFREPYAVTHRTDIHAAFLHACEKSNLISLETRRRVLDFEDRGDGVMLRFEDGERADGRALIGCDGMWSHTREDRG
jgi:2-polyprenyl-6-methoxyphenol hydroxylase-like FAD-dependent oxidoreductase